MMFSDENHRRFFYEENIFVLRDVAIRQAESIIGNHPDAEDAVHDAMLNAWICLEQLSDEQHAKPWFLTIVRNCSFSILNKYEKDKAIPYDEFAFLLSSNDLFDRGFLMYGIAAAMQKLPPKYRQHLMLKCIYGYTTEEICIMTGVGSHTHSSNLCRARKEFSKLYDEINRK